MGLREVAASTTDLPTCPTGAVPWIVGGAKTTEPTDTGVLAVVCCGDDMTGVSVIAGLIVIAGAVLTGAPFLVTAIVKPQPRYS